MWCLPSRTFLEKSMGYKIEISITDKDGGTTRCFLRPSGCGPYVFATDDEAEQVIRLCYADPGARFKAKPRVVQTDEEVTHG